MSFVTVPVKGKCRNDRIPSFYVNSRYFLHHITTKFGSFLMRNSYVNHVQDFDVIPADRRVVLKQFTVFPGIYTLF